MEKTKDKNNSQNKRGVFLMLKIQTIAFKTKHW